MKKFIVIGLIIIIAGGLVWWGFSRSRTPSPLDQFASCLKEKGAVMYGTSWCPYCKKQKELFGRAVSKIAYIECSVPGSPQAQAKVCRDKDIKGYPTWIFFDGSRVSGVQELDELAKKTGCELPKTP